MLTQWYVIKFLHRKSHVLCTTSTCLHRLLSWLTGATWALFSVGQTVPQAHLALLGTGFSGSATAQTTWSVLTGITSTAWTMCMSMIMSFSPMKVALNFNNCLMVCRSKSGGEYILSFGLDGMPMKDKKVSYTFVQCLIPLGYHQE